MKVNPKEDETHHDLIKLLAAFRRLNAQLSALKMAHEHPDFFNLDGVIDDSAKTIEMANELQMAILDKYGIQPADMFVFADVINPNSSGTK